MSDITTNQQWIQSMQKDELAEFLTRLLSKMYDFNESVDWVKTWLDLPKGENMPPKLESEECQNT